MRGQDRWWQWSAQACREPKSPKAATLSPVQHRGHESSSWWYPGSQWSQGGHFSKEKSRQNIKTMSCVVMLVHVWSLPRRLLQHLKQEAHRSPAAPAPPLPSSYQPKEESPSTSTHCPRRKAERLYIEVNINEQEVKMSVWPSPCCMDRKFLTSDQVSVLADPGFGSQQTWSEQWNEHSQQCCSGVSTAGETRPQKEIWMQETPK